MSEEEDDFLRAHRALHELIEKAFARMWRVKAIAMMTARMDEGY